MTPNPDPRTAPDDKDEAVKQSPGPTPQSDDAPGNDGVSADEPAEGADSDRNPGSPDG